jgi:tetratricopeptide (TPR) repeat protein
MGPAGIGKSRLAAELSASVAEGTRVLAGPCLPYGDGITFWPLGQIIGGLGGEVGVRNTLAGAEDADVVADRVLGAVSPTPVSAPGGELFWAFRRLFEEVARDEPLVLVIEDIHWAESKLLDLLEYLTGWTDDAAILLVCLARPELLEERPGWLSVADGASLLLGPLTEDESATLLTEIGREWPLDAAARARITEAAEGNPLYVEQMAVMLAEGKSLESIPPSIHALLAARLDRLPAEHRAVLERAAVAGKDFTRRFILGLSPEEEHGEIDARLLDLVRRDFLSARPGREDNYRFRHVLIRDAAYAGIPKELRAQLHERFAGLAERTPSGRAGEIDEIIGYHYEQAFRYREQLGPLDDRARELSRRAAEILGGVGRRAYARDDMPAAINLLDRAVSLLSGQEPAQLALRRELSNALWSVGELARAEALLDGLIEAASEMGDHRERWQGLLERSGRLSVTHPEAESDLLETAEEAVKVFQELGDDLGLARAWRRISAVRRLRCNFASALDAAEVGLVHARKAGASQEQARLVDEICSALLFGPAPVLDAIQRCEALLGDSPDSRMTEANVSSSLAGLRAMRGDFDEARAHVAAARGVYSDLGLRFAIAGLDQIAGWVEVLSGDAEAAEREFRNGYEILADVGARDLLAAELARVLVAEGRLDEGEQYVAIAEEASGGDIAPQIIWRAVKARLAATKGSEQEAVKLASAAVALAQQTDAIAMIADANLALADVLRIVGREHDAHKAAERALAHYSRKGHTIGEARADAFVASRLSQSP